MRPMTHLAELGKLKIPALFQGWRPHLLALVGWAALWGVAGFLVDPKTLIPDSNLEPREWLVVAGALMLFPVGITVGILLSVGRGQSAPIYEMIFERHMVAQKHRQRWQKLAEAERKQREEKFVAWQKVVTAKREAGVRKADGELSASLQKVEDRRVQELAVANQKYPALLVAITQRRDQQLGWANTEFPQRLEKLKSRFEWDLGKFRQNRDAEVAANTQRFQTTWLRTAEAWLEGWQQLERDIDAANQTVDEWFHDWPT